MGSGQGAIAALSRQCCELAPVPTVQSHQALAHHLLALADGRSGGGLQLLQPFAHNVHHRLGLEGVMPDVRIAPAVMVMVLVLVLVLVIVIGFGFGFGSGVSAGRALRHCQLGHGHGPRQFLQGRGERVAVDQHEAGLLDLLALARTQQELVGIVVGIEQAVHPQVGGGQAAGEIAQHAIGGNHLHGSLALAGRQQQSAGAGGQQGRCQVLPGGRREAVSHRLLAAEE